MIRVNGDYSQHFINMGITTKITERLITLRFMGAFGLVHRPELGNTTFQKRDIFPSPGEEKETLLCWAS
jgi:hypothetical protein